MMSKDITDRFFTLLKAGATEKVRRYLLNTGIKPEKIFDKDGSAPLYIAVSKDQRELARVLLEEGRVNPNAICKYYPGQPSMGEERPLYRAIRNGKTEMVRLLLSHGASPNDFTNTIGYRPLAITIENNQQELARVLLEHGADAKADLLLEKAIKYRQPEMFHLLVSHGADPKAGLLLHKAILYDQPEMAHLLLAHGADPNKLDYQGRTLLHTVVKYGYVALARELIRRGDMDINKASQFGMTPLHIATDNNHADIVELLLAAGANPSPKDADATPLHKATMAGYVGIVESLLAHGANPDVLDKDGKRPLDLAIEKKKYGKPSLRRFYDRIIQMLSPVPAPIPVLGKEVLPINAYKDLKVDPDAKDHEIRAAYIKLRRAVERASASSSSSSGSKPSLASITASYNILKNHRAAYDEVIDKPRRALMAKIKAVCFNDVKDPVSLKKFEKMTVEELRRVYVVSSSQGKRIEEASATRSRGHCFEKDTLKAMVRNGIRTNPMNRAPLQPALLAELAAASHGGRATRRGI